MIIKNEKKKNTCFYISCFAFVSTPVLRSLFFFGIKSRNNLIKTEEEKKRKERTGAERCRKHFQSLGGGCGGCFADVKWQTRSRCVAGHIPAPYSRECAAKRTIIRRQAETVATFENFCLRSHRRRFGQPMGCVALAKRNDKENLNERIKDHRSRTVDPTEN